MTLVIAGCKIFPRESRHWKFIFQDIPSGCAQHQVWASKVEAKVDHPSCIPVASPFFRVNLVTTSLFSLTGNHWFILVKSFPNGRKIQVSEMLRFIQKSQLEYVEIILDELLQWLEFPTCYILARFLEDYIGHAGWSHFDLGAREISDIWVTQVGVWFHPWTSSQNHHKFELPSGKLTCVTAFENGPCIVELPSENGDFPVLC